MLVAYSLETWFMEPEEFVVAVVPFFSSKLLFFGHCFKNSVAFFTAYSLALRLIRVPYWSMSTSGRASFMIVLIKLSAYS